MTPLHWACHKGHEAIAVALVTNGASLNLEAKVSMCILISAVWMLLRYIWLVHTSAIETFASTATTATTSTTTTLSDWMLLSPLVIH